MRPSWRIALVTAMAVLLLTAVATAADIAGSYSCRGTNPDGSPYVGSVAITENGGGYTLRWTFGSSGHTGTGLLVNNQLSASFGVQGGQYGIVVYQLYSDGRLVGKWMNPSGGALGTETLMPQSRY